MRNEVKGEEKQRQMFLSLYNNDYEYLFCEIPVFARSVDVVKYNVETNSITAIEFKLNDWKRVIKQALDVRISFDYLEICVLKPKTEKTQRKIIDECERKGIGLYFYNEFQMTFEKILEPLKMQEVWGTQKLSIIEYLKKNIFRGKKCLNY